MATVPTRSGSPRQLTTKQTGDAWEAQARRWLEGKGLRFIAANVNERGGEILNLPSGTQIIPHDVSKRVAGGQTVQVYVTVQGNIIGNRQYADELGETIVQRILRALDNM